MGFLDRMVSDLIYKNTGFRAHGLVRKVGSKNILLAGAGAVLAAALSEQKSGTAATTPAAQPMTPHPQPAPAAPAPTSAAPSPPVDLPPLPPVPTEAPAPPQAQSTPQAPRTPPPAAAPQSEPPAPELEAIKTEDPPPEVAFLAVRTLVAAAHADGTIAPAEKEIIERHLASSNLTPVQQKQIHDDLMLPPSPIELAALTDDPNLRAALYRFAVLMVKVDKDVAELEKAWLVRLGDAFELPLERRRSLEDEVFGDA